MKAISKNSDKCLFLFQKAGKTPLKNNFSTIWRVPSTTTENPLDEGPSFKAYNALLARDIYGSHT